MGEPLGMGLFFSFFDDPSHRGFERNAALLCMGLFCGFPHGPPRGRFERKELAPLRGCFSDFAHTRAAGVTTAQGGSY
jgi:hypothetical protein